MDVLFILCDPKQDLTDAWKAKAQELLTASERSAFKIQECYLHQMDEQFDCVVSAANSFGIMDGAVDLAISNMFCVGNIQAPIDAVQRHLHTTWNGFQPVGTSTIVDMSAFKNRHNCRYIAHTPTMRTPMNVRWDKEIVYRCFWSVLNALDLHNQSSPKKRIQSVLCFGLGTGVGQIPADVCAHQMILSWKNYQLHKQHGYQRIGWKEAHSEMMGVEETHRVPSMYGLR